MLSFYYHIKTEISDNNAIPFAIGKSRIFNCSRPTTTITFSRSYSFHLTSHESFETDDIIPHTSYGCTRVGVYWSEIHNAAAQLSVILMLK